MGQTNKKTKSDKAHPVGYKKSISEMPYRDVTTSIYPFIKAIVNPNSDKKKHFS